MTPSPKKPGVPFWATVAVVCLLPFGGYMAAYLWFVEPVTRETKIWITKLPKYAKLGESPHWQTFFDPAHTIDRRLRPKVWQREAASPNFLVSERTRSAD